jgi:hypothetical protein
MRMKMSNLKELFIDLEKEGYFDRLPKNLGGDNSIVYGESQMLPILDRIKETDEFSDVEELNLLYAPYVHTINGEKQQIKTYKFKGGEKIKGKAYLISIQLSGEIFYPHNLVENVVDGGAISPKQYDAVNFKPSRQILLDYNPDKYKNFDVADNDNLIRQELHDKLDEILKDKDKYLAKGERVLLVRGYFESIETPNVKEPEKFKTVIPDPKAYIAFYMEKESTKDGFSGKLKQKIIPAELREEYLKEFGDRGIDVSGSEIDEFLANRSV